MLSPMTCAMCSPTQFASVVRHVVPLLRFAQPLGLSPLVEYRWVEHIQPD